MAEQNPIDRRKKNRNWYVADDKGEAWNDVRGGVLLAVMLDLRDELRGLRQEIGAIRARLECSAFGALPYHVRRIAENTKRKRKKT